MVLTGLLLLNGCVKVDTNPQTVFNEIQKDISERTDQDIYWDYSLHEVVSPISYEELLEKELNENSAVAIALLNNRTLQAFYESLGIAKAGLSQAGLLKNPIFSFSNRFSTTSGVTDLIDMSLIQNFLEILLIPLKKKMAHAELEATKALVMTKVLDVIAETKISFYTLVAANETWHLKKQILLATELSYTASQKLFDAGNMRALDVSMQKSFYENAKLEVASWEIAVLQAREKLNILMGLWGCGIEWEFCSQFHQIPKQEENFCTIENDAIMNSIDLRVSYNELLAIAAGFGIDTSKLIFPQLDIGVSAEREDSLWYVGPAFNLAIPFFDFGQANSAKAESTILQKWNEYTALAIEIRSKARSARFTLLNAFRQAEYLKKVIVPLSEQITHETLLQHNAMQIGVFELLLAKQREIEDQIQFIHRQREYWISKVELQTLLNGHIFGKTLEMHKRQ